MVLACGSKQQNALAEIIISPNKKRLVELSFSPALLFIVFILIINAILNHYFA